MSFSFEELSNLAEFMIKKIAEKHAASGVGNIIWDDIVAEVELSYPFEYTDEMIDVAIELIMEAADKYEKQMENALKVPPGATIH